MRGILWIYDTDIIINFIQLNAKDFLLSIVQYVKYSGNNGVTGI